MNIKGFRESFETEEGQAIIIGALMMLILAFGLIVTLNLGKAVEEKINLQNHSDAAAYSLAVIEAQAFNYIAFTNRVQAAHYNMIMTVQTYQALLLLIESILGAVYDFFFTLYGIFFWVPWGIGKALGEIARVYGLLMKGIRYLLHGAESGKPKDFGLISIMGYAKQAVWYINYAHYIANLVVAGSVWFKVLANMGSITSKNDSRLTNNIIANGLTMGLNGYEYLKSFDKYAGGIPPFPSAAFDKSIKGKERITGNRDPRDSDYDNPYTRADEARFRQKLMGDISNGSRSRHFNSSQDKTWTIGTEGFFTFAFRFTNIGVTKLLGVSPRILSKNTDLEQKFYDMGNTVGNGSFLETGLIPELRHGREARSAGSWGDIVASDKAMQLGFSIGFEIPVIGFLGFEKSWGQGNYIWSDNYGGNYWRWRAPDKQTTGICFSNDNKECLESQVSDISEPRELYIRMPVRLYDLLGPIKDFITFVRKTNLFVPIGGCKLQMTSFGQGGKNWTDDFGGTTSGFNRYKCHHKNSGLCRRSFGLFGCCKALGKTACNLEGKLKKKLQNHEYITEELGGTQFYMGISPFVKFLPNSSRLQEFNQPSTWSFLNLKPEHFMKDNPWNFEGENDITGTSSNTVNNNADSWSEHSKSIDSNIGSQKALSTDPMMPGGERFSETRVLNLLDPGLNTISRARVYYHRPDNWNEHPNFFNPYWRAQLAPIAPKLSNLVKRTLNSLKLDSDVEGESGMGSEINNALGSLSSFFAETVAKIVTH